MPDRSHDYDVTIAWMTVQLALRNLMLHKLRSFLTMLGTVLGVASVISMLSVGEGSKREAIERIRSLGASNVIIRTVKPKQQVMPQPAGGSGQGQRAEQATQLIEYGLSYRDFDRLRSTLPGLEQAAPISLARQNAQNGRRRIENARVLGVTPALLNVKRLSVQRGRFVSYSDVDRTGNVAVLAAGAADRLFGYEDPIGRSVLLGLGAYRVVGVLDAQASGNATPGAIDREDFNDDIYIPITAVQRRIGERQRVGALEFERVQLHEITLTMADEDLVRPTADMARKLLVQTHPRGDDFEIQVPLELLEQAEHERRIWNLVLGSIAGISLLVGGIGIMNIMLATVTERTREIGIRRALGAKRRDITLQFLVESTALSAIGGLIGIAVGLSIPLAITFMSEIETALSLAPIIVSFIVSVGIGIGFGVYPARRAALMDPIEALRHE